MERTPVAGACPECGAAALERYPLLSQRRWQIVTKCRACLCSVEREPWGRKGYGPHTYLVDGLG